MEKNIEVIDHFKMGFYKNFHTKKVKAKKDDKVRRVERFENIILKIFHKKVDYENNLNV